MKFEYYVINRDNGKFVAREILRNEEVYGYYHTDHLKWAIRFTTAENAMKHMDKVVIDGRFEAIRYDDAMHIYNLRSTGNELGVEETK